MAAITGSISLFSYLFLAWRISSGHGCPLIAVIISSKKTNILVKKATIMWKDIKEKNQLRNHI